MSSPPVCNSGQKKSASLTEADRSYNRSGVYTKKSYSITLGRFRKKYDNLIRHTQTRPVSGHSFSCLYLTKSDYLFIIPSPYTPGCAPPYIFIDHNTKNRGRQPEYSVMIAPLISKLKISKLHFCENKRIALQFSTEFSIIEKLPGKGVHVYVAQQDRATAS